jgi:glycosyltransferase involved in cell wall biosynthesis
MPDGFRRLIERRAFERWGYFMADGGGVDPRCLPMAQTHVLSCFDRALLASRWAYIMALRTIEPKPPTRIDWMPHGINTEVFKPVERELARSVWGVSGEDVVIGCVMANQARKHWPVVMEAVARMPAKPYLWIHTDYMQQHWNLNALAFEYGLGERCFLDQHQLSDREMAMRYSGCDATVVISGGEGFCYPAAESLACGTPVIVGEYGAAAELGHYGVGPTHTQLDTIHNVRRAYYDSRAVAEALQQALQWDRESARGRVEHLEWNKLSIQWKKWVRRGLSPVVPQMDCWSARPALIQQVESGSETAAVTQPEHPSTITIPM